MTYQSKKNIFILYILAIIVNNSCASKKFIYLGIPGVVKVVNKVIFLKPGEIPVNSTFTIPDGFTLQGEKSFFTFEKLKEYPIIKLNGSTDVTLKDISIKGSKLDIKKYPTSYYFWLERNNFVQLSNCSKINFSNCSFENSYGTVIHISDSKEINFKKCSIQEVGLTTGPYNYSYDGIFIGGQKHTSQITVDSCYFYNIGRNFPLYPDPAYYFNDGDGIHIQGLVGSLIENIVITNSTFEKCSSRGVKIQTGKHIKVNNNKFIESGCGVVMAIVEPIYDIDLSNNFHKDVQIPYSSETMGTNITVYDLTINNNHVVGLCNWFMRTGGGSNVENGVFNNNVIEDSGMHVFAGRFSKSKITNNIVKSFGSRKYLYHMALEIGSESDDLLIENNYFGKFSEQNFEMTNYSKSKNVIVRNNKMEFSKTKREKQEKK